VTSSAQPSKGALAERWLVTEVISAYLDIVLTIRAMEMDRVCFVGFVDESHHRFSSVAHHESRARRHAIIANEFGLAQIRVDLQSD